MAPSKQTTSEPKEEPSSSPAADGGAADLAQAYRDLARGEQAATALEANLTNLESRLDALLAAFEAQEGQALAGQAKINGKEKKDTKDDEEKNPASDATSS